MQITLLRDYLELIHMNSPHAKKSPSSNDHRTIDKSNQQPNLNLRSKIFELSSILDCAKVSVNIGKNKFHSNYWPFAFIRFVWFMRRSNRLIQRSIYWKSKQINGNFWLIHSQNICECALRIWVYRTGNYALHTHAIYHHGLNNYFYYSHRIYLNTTAIYRNQIVHHQVVHGSLSFITNWIYPFFDQNQNAVNKQINLINEWCVSSRNV